MASFGALAAWALSSPANAIRALSLSWLGAFLNPAVFGVTPDIGALRWLILGIAAFRIVVLSAGLRADRPGAKSLILFAVVVVAEAFLQNKYPHEFAVISLFKALSFLLGSLTVVLGFSVCAKKGQSDQLRRWFSTLVLTLVLLSTPLIFSQPGYIRNGRDFQGILAQPQAYGLFLAVACAWLLGRVFLQRQRGFWTIVAMCVSVVSLYLTHSRTGVLAVLVGLLGALAIMAVINSQALGWVHRFLLSPITVCACLLGSAGLLFFEETVSEQASLFLVKGQAGTTLSKSFEGSRERLYDNQLRGFSTHPFLGIGFGLPSDSTSFAVTRDPVFDLPVSAPTEKGGIFVALLEETGLIGMAAFLYLLKHLIRPIVRQGHTADLWVAFTSLAVNIGEGVLFSLGGMGLLIWLMLGLSRSQQ